MKKLGFLAVLIASVAILCSFAHKFYVGIYQINYASDKKMLQITSRIFVDDLNAALEKKFKHKFHLGENSAAQAEISEMNKYVSENFRIIVNGRPQMLDYRSCELENNVLVCYYRITSVDRVASLEIVNKILFDFVTEQQNIIQTNVGGNKQNLLLTADEPSGKLSF